MQTLSSSQPSRGYAFAYSAEQIHFDSLGEELGCPSHCAYNLNNTILAPYYMYKI